MSTINRSLKPYPSVGIGLVDTSSVDAWVPTDMTQAIAWYKAKLMTGFADNDPLSTVEDFIGSFDGTASGARRPLYKTNAGDPYIHFTGGMDLMTTITNAFTDFAVIVVVEFDALASARRLIDKNYLTGFWTGNAPGVSFNNLGGGIQEGSIPYGAYVTITTGVRYAFLFERNGSVKRIRINGSQSTVACSATACDSTPLQIGGNAGGAGDLTAKIFEIIICDNNLTTPDDTNLNTYMLSEYGLNF